MSKDQTVYYISKLIYKSVYQTISSKEVEELNEWLQIESNQELYARISQKEAINNKKRLYKKSNKKEVLKRIQKKIQEKKKSKRDRLKVYNLLKYAAVLAMFLAIGNFVYKASFNQDTQKAITKQAIKKIKTGYKKATLVLSDGTTVDLEQHKNEWIVSNNRTQIQNTDAGLVYNLSTMASKKTKSTQPLKYNTLQVPIGGIYQVKLPDGTKVWLNSASSLTYPEKFTGTQRLVKLDGEAYFEVTKRAKEFVVQTNTANVTVLGTHFNVSAYNNDSFFSSTLVEGRIKLTTPQDLHSHSPVILTPNQRGVINKSTSKMEVSTIDTDVFTAWKEGKFYFEKERLDQIVTRMARWYNVDIVFQEDALKEKTFTGVMLKNKSIEYLLNMIRK
ncbi:MAG: FecR family protein, partial [Polaribacter sp.]